MDWDSVWSGGGRHWTLTAQDLTARLAAQEALQRRYPGTYGDGTPIIRGNEWYWLSTALPTGAVVLLLCFVAAGMASWMAQQQEDGVVAAWVTALVGGVLPFACRLAWDPALHDQVEPRARTQWASFDDFRNRANGFPSFLTQWTFG